MNQKEWTIMIYMAGDNNLAVDMAYALDQIKEIPRDGEESPNLFVYYDGNSPQIPTLYCDFSDPQKPRYVRSFKVPDKLYPVRGQKENENAAHRHSVVNFVDWCVNKVQVERNGEITYGRRARRYALIFSGHSLGFQDIGLFKDESSGKTMKMDDLYFMLQRIADKKEDLEKDARKNKLKGEERERETTELIGQKLDILGFDSCVMGMFEVGYQFGSVAKTMIASEGSVPSAGWTYAKILGCLAGGDSINNESEKVAEHFVKQFVQSQDAYTVGGVSVDMAAWDLCKFKDLAVAFDNLSVALLDCFKDESSRVYRQMERVILQVHWKCQSYMFDQNVDLGDFCELLDRECGLVADELGGESDDVAILRCVQEECRNVLSKLEDAVILSGFSGGAYQYSNGISVFFPWSREGYEASKKNYESLWFARDLERKQLSWMGFLKKYLYEVALRKFEPPTMSFLPGKKYKYFSGITFDDQSDAMTFIQETDGRIAGHEGSRIAGQEGSRIAGQEGSRIAGQEGSRIAGQEGSRIAGQEGSRIAGQEGSRLAGGGSNAFFNNLRLYKNIESRWNISGFSKKASEYE
jgi:Clostripain family